MVLSPVVLAVTVNSAYAQSSDRSQPTLLSSDTLSGTGTYQQEQIHFYRFLAGPGELVVTLDVDAGSTNGNGVVPSVSLQDVDGGTQFADLDAYATPGNPGHTVKRVNFSKATPVIMLVNLPGGTTGNYTYRMKLNGAFRPIADQTSSQGTAPVQIRAGEKAVVRFQLSNGVVQEIDLSKVQGITVNH